MSEELRPGAERKLTGKEEALLVATACAKPPAGRKRWTLTLLADTMVKLTDHDSLSGDPCVAGWPRMTSSHGAGTCGAFPMSMANMSLAWKMCSISMLKRLILSGPWSASTRPRPADRRGAPAGPGPTGTTRAL